LGEGIELGRKGWAYCIRRRRRWVALKTIFENLEFSVFGGCEVGEKLENNRQYGQKIFSISGIKTKASVDFYSIDEIIHFLKKQEANGLSSRMGTWIKG